MAMDEATTFVRQTSDIVKSTGSDVLEKVESQLKVSKVGLAYRASGTREQGAGCSGTKKSMPSILPDPFTLFLN